MGPEHAIYSRKSSLDAGSFAEESGVVLVRWLDAPRQIVYPLHEHTRVRQYPPAVTAIKICPPSVSDTHAPPNPESASIGRNLGWRN